MDCPLQQAGLLQSNSSLRVSEPGQPLFLRYQPQPLLRGLPADSWTWQAKDQFNEAGPLARVEVHIRCSPGYFYRDEDPSHCAACGPGYYNLPGEKDQVGPHLLAGTRL